MPAELEGEMLCRATFGADSAVVCEPVLPGRFRAQAFGVFSVGFRSKGSPSTVENRVQGF